MKTLKTDAVIDNLGVVSEFVDSFLEELGCGLKTQMQIDLSVEEIYVNIAHYAYQGKSGDVEIRLSESEGVVDITFVDSGVPYDPLKKTDPDITLSADDRQIGGLGIFLVKKNMDHVSYRYENGNNILKITKKI